ncbi:hypothetical protein OE88DRAFT_1715312 [Heliocybe sulcata]|uniref:Uncharacterized protein n=1 Tax=Heliocybe sulcata TaxID=5364 RepID=A0A5C3MNI2_9AGAM|nr:hypothetical protein OE88DRAFT_1715312 [Heliocybe sulcata]
MPNPDRILADGLEFECPPIVVFIDDVSGNSTKQWNVHYSCYLSNGGLPRSAIEKEIHTKFVATSPHASPMEILRAVCETLKSTQSGKPFRVWDCVRRRYVLIRPWLLFLPGDNPMQAEAASHIGMQGNQFCRRCHAGGTKEFKESDEGYPTLMMASTPGVLREAEKTREAIVRQLIMATHAAAEKPLKDAMTATGVKDSFATPLINRLIAMGKTLRRSTEDRAALTPEEVNALLTEELMKHKNAPVVNPLLTLKGFDVHKDTPVEPLHTHLLGLIKYFWAQTVWVLEKSGKFHSFQTHLNSLNQDGLNIPNIMGDYMCRYRGGLIGKHFKTLSQVMAFAVHGLVDRKLQGAWDALGRLTVLIWATGIVNMETHINNLRAAINEVLDCAADCSPALLTNKAKPHILSHLPEDVLRFGPALLMSTERYEKFNRVFRLCSIYSNRQAPSRDIAATFAQLERCRHIVTGGYWFDRSSQRWVCAGKSVKDHIRNHRLDAGLLGGQRICPLLSWEQTGAYAMGLAWASPQEGRWHLGASFVLKNGNVARLGSDVLHITGVSLIFAILTINSLSFGCIREILSAQDASIQSLAVIELSAVEPLLHSSLQLPVIRRTGTLIAVPLSVSTWKPDSGLPLSNIFHQEITAVINTQHDCERGSCRATASRVMQEREETAQTRAVIQHSDSPYSIINMYALHNNLQLQAAVPPHLQLRQPLYPDRTTLHRGAAASLRDTKLQKKLAKEAAIPLAVDEPNDEESVAVAGANGEQHTVQDPWPSNDLFVNAPVRMRGPRGRRGMAASSTLPRQPIPRRTERCGGTTMDPSSSTAGNHDQNSESIGAISDQNRRSGNEQARKRRRAVADPVASEVRETEIREAFDAL